MVFFSNYSTLFLVLVDRGIFPSPSVEKDLLSDSGYDKLKKHRKGVSLWLKL